MIGIWNCKVITNQLKLKIVFNVEENDGITLAMSTEPYWVSIGIVEIKAEGDRLIAVGQTKYSPEPILIDLQFAEDTFTGKLKLPFVGEMEVQGERGKGTSFTEELIAIVAPFRKDHIAPRTDEEIQGEIESLLGRMSVQDKLGQMSQCIASNFSFGAYVASAPPEQLVAEGKVGSILGAFDSSRVFALQKTAVEQSPHKIPLLFNADIIHGHQTIFPVPLGWSCSWDLEAIKQACAIAAKEATASGITYNHGPMVDVTRDPRWGRVVEGAGEDPYLGSLIAKAQVEGFQGDSLFSEETLIACLKHFIAYGAAESGRDYNTVDISEGTLRNVYLPPFQAGLEAGAGSVMNAFNIYQGVPVAGSSYLLKDILRDELGFDGMLISDYGSIDEIQIHGAAKDAEAAARMAIDATMDIEMVTRLYYDRLPRLVEEGVVKEVQLDAAVRRILTYKFKIGIMDDPYRYIRPEKEIEYHFHSDHLRKSRELAQKSIVLLKNNGVLPLIGKKKIAVIGPFAASKDMLGPWQFSRYGNDTVTLLQGLMERGIDSENLLYAEGCGVNSSIEGGMDRAVALAQKADVVILALGENSAMSGEAASRADITLPDVQQQLAEAIVNLGKPTIMVLTNGRPLVLDWFDRHVDAIVETWFLGSQAGNAIADVLFGDYNPSGKLTMCFPYKVGQAPLYYNHFNTGRPLNEANKARKFVSKYLDTPNEPLYPFGYGLSYTTFAYSDIQLDKVQLSRNDKLNISVIVTNTGNYAGEEIVQLYIQDLYGSTVRPVKELKRFEKIYLKPEESREVRFAITEEDLKFYTANRRYEAEAGDFKVYVGPSSQVVKEANFELI
ncbi:glycoside hydrolase family 3 N-terminal domain-containing protein [Paenibacillus qinlingensis]|uniref:glycoside hydrolase family 3 N-terminal domain-containing protein n=1 Tax=Paenibacillus qinlingensis TaxID=1837343 RepID=UPI0015637AED|nr:glycoside hydrolase family 3 N-terminal domain-containing protein [Paenibacillus qinlingensis]NQX60491.1 glycoside hydrolase family 3 C-terminal domain-containing protein [Paenibacillus qinlingensis]